MLTRGERVCGGPPPSPSEGGEPKPAMRKYTMFVFVGMKYAVTYKLL